MYNKLNLCIVLAIHCLNIGEKNWEKVNKLKQKLKDAGIRYWAGDNISEVLQEGDKDNLLKKQL